MFRNSLAALFFTLGAVQARSFPKLPKVFSTIVEGNIINRNRTVLMEEAYDFYQQTSYRKIYSNHHPNTSHNILSNYTEHQQWSWWTNHVDQSVANCQVTPIHSFGGRRSSSHLPSVNEFLSIGNTSTETYVGIRSARGIPCEVWSRHILQTRQGRVRFLPFQNVSWTENYTLFYYFALEPWTFFEPETRIPIRAVIKGTNTVIVYGSPQNNSNHTFDHYYEFVKFEEPPRIDFNAFQSPAKASWTSQCNTTTFCASPGKNTTAFCQEARGKKPPQFANVFKANMQVTLGDREETMWYSESYDGINQTVHGDFLRAGHPKRHQYDKLKEKESWNWVDGGKCVLLPLNASKPRDHFFRFENHQLVSPRHWIGFYNKPIWKGHTMVRGIKAEHWSDYHSSERMFHGIKIMENRSYEIFVVDEEWRMPHNQTSVPIRRIDDITRIWPNGTIKKRKILIDIISWVPGEAKTVGHTENDHENHRHDHHDEIDHTWRSMNCDVSAYCAMYPKEDECVEPPLPKLPNQFSARVEATISNRRYSFAYIESFDYPGNRFFSRTIIRNSVRHEWALLNDKIVYHWETPIGNRSDVRSCNVSAVTVNSTKETTKENIFDPRGHLKTASSWFNFGSEFKEKYMGQKTIRGVQTDVWARKVNWSIPLPPRPSGSRPPPPPPPPGNRAPPHHHQQPQQAELIFDLVHYFTDKTVYGKQIPVRTTVKGISTFGHRHMFDHTYDYFEFRSGAETRLDVFGRNNPVHHGWVSKCNVTNFCQIVGNANKPICTQGPKSIQANVCQCPSESENCTDDCTVVGVVSGVVSVVVAGVIAAGVFYYCQKKDTHVRFMDDSDRL